MSFKTVAELVGIAEKKNQKISEIMLIHESETMNRSKEEIFIEMGNHLDVMEEAIHRGLTENVRSQSGLSGGDARKIKNYIKTASKSLSGQDILEAVLRATATSEMNAAMGTIVATPTAGACGILPGTIFATARKFNSDRDTMIRALFVAGAFGFVIANNSFISGAAGGCQAEVGSATAMAAAAVVEMAGGTPRMSGEAAAMALKNVLGLVCDPVAGLVEAPCVKRNAMGSAMAMVAADLSLAGVKSVIPTDEVISAMYRIGQSMPVSLKETALGGLAATPTAKKVEGKIFNTGNSEDEFKKSSS